MKISAMSNLNNANSSINFGRYANKKVKKEVEKMGEEYVDYYGRIGCEVSIEASKRRYNALDFLEKTPYVTIKKKGDIVYAVMNNNEIEKHPSKERLKENLNSFLKFNRDHNLDVAYGKFKTNEQSVKRARKVLEIMDGEKDFLIDAEHFDDLIAMQKNIEKADMDDLYY